LKDLAADGGLRLCLREGEVIEAEDPLNNRQRIIRVSYFISVFVLCRFCGNRLIVLLTTAEEGMDSIPQCSDYYSSDINARWLLQGSDQDQERNQENQTTHEASSPFRCFAIFQRHTFRVLISTRGKQEHIDKHTCHKTT
jgi:hypothetical protein